MFRRRGVYEQCIGAAFISYIPIYFCRRDAACGGLRLFFPFWVKTQPAYLFLVGNGSLICCSAFRFMPCTLCRCRGVIKSSVWEFCSFSSISMLLLGVSPSISSVFSWQNCIRSAKSSGLFSLLMFLALATVKYYNWNLIH